MTKLCSINSKLTLQYITLTDYYIVKKHIQIISNDRAVNVLSKSNIKCQNCIKIHSKFTLQYITPTDHYIVKDIHLDHHNDWTINVVIKNKLK